MEHLNIKIRPSEINDLNQIMLVEKSAFGGNNEAKLTADLLSDPTANPIVSLLAFHNNQAVGHILFTRVYINNMQAQDYLHILAPLAVIPAYQNKGIGGMLIKKGLEILKEMGSKIVFVLGHMDYYPKYGFIPDAKKQGFEAPFTIPPEFSNAWMLQYLSPEKIQTNKVQIVCANAMNKEEYWRE